jgi:photosynthetic reaction center H subunit
MKSYDPNVRVTDDASREPRDDEGRLVHLEEVKDRFRVADGNPDIRGWDVRAREGRKIGEVDDLVVDTGKRKVRYLEVKVDKDVAGTDEDRWMLFPIGKARLDDDADEVRLSAPASDIRGMPTRDRGRFTADEDRSLRERFRDQSPRARRDSADDDAELFDEQRFLGKRGRPDAASADQIYLVPVAVVAEVEVVRAAEPGDAPLREEMRDPGNAARGTERRPDAR